MLKVLELVVAVDVCAHEHLGAYELFHDVLRKRESEKEAGGERAAQQQEAREEKRTEGSPPFLCPAERVWEVLPHLQIRNVMSMLCV